MATWGVRDQDREFFERELQSFVPDRVYDAHAHLWRASDWEGREPEAVKARISTIGKSLPPILQQDTLLGFRAMAFS